MSANTSESSDDSHSTQTRVRRSKVWEYFEQNLVEADDGFKAVCKYCQIRLSTKSGTSSLGPIFLIIVMQLGKLIGKDL